MGVMSFDLFGLIFRPTMNCAKIQSLIQVFSQAIGLTGFTLVARYLYDELTLDRANPNFNQVRM